MKKEQVLRRIRVRSTRVLTEIGDHLSDHPPALGQNQKKEQKRVERKLSHIKGRYDLGMEDQIENMERAEDIKGDKRKLTLSSPDHPVRKGHNTEDQFDPEEAENNSTAPTPRSKERQVIGLPEAEEVINSIARRGQEERTVEDPSPLRG
ncbi:hypothetical protein TNCV_1575171 [Trichonephila clavipes]|nr:hypothetical protein TNCV_1575171 [Trichonephila clavipes]